MLNELKKIKAFAFDCDGVMTNGTALMTENGQALRSFNIKDGFAVQHAVKEQYPITIISGGNNIGIKHRFEALGVKDIYLAQQHKVEAFEKLSQNTICRMKIFYTWEMICQIYLYLEFVV